MSNTTKPSATLLTDGQEVALRSLLTGSSITAAAEQAGVDRTTLWRWRRNDPAFVAELNSRRAAMRDEFESSLFALAGSAIQALQKALDKGEWKPALEVVRGLGFLAPVHIGEQNIDGALKEIRLQKMERANGLAQRQAIVSFDCERRFEGLPDVDDDEG